MLVPALMRSSASRYKVNVDPPRPVEDRRRLAGAKHTFAASSPTHHRRLDAYRQARAARRALAPSSLLISKERRHALAEIVERRARVTDYAASPETVSIFPPRL